MVGNKVLLAFRAALTLHGTDSIPHRSWSMLASRSCEVHLLFHGIPKVLHWIGIWWLWSPFEFKKAVLWRLLPDGRISSNCWCKAGWFSCCLHQIMTPASKCHSRNWASSDKTLCNFGKSLQIVTSFLFLAEGAAHSVVLCCYGQSSSKFSMFGIQRSSSAHVGCNKLLFQPLSRWL